MKFLKIRALVKNKALLLFEVIIKVRAILNIQKKVNPHRKEAD